MEGNARSLKRWDERQWSDSRAFLYGGKWNINLYTNILIIIFLGVKDGKKIIIMKRNLFVAIMTVVSVFVAKAQNNDLPMATLQHGDQTLVFTGVDAFTAAYAAAADKGDVITLSSGVFNFTTSPATQRFSKSLVVRGAGFEDDVITETKATVVNSGIHIGNEEITGYDDDGNPIVNVRKADGSKFEGIAFTQIRFYNGLNDVTFAKCNFNDITIGYTFKNDEEGITCSNITIRQCVFNRILYSGNGRCNIIDNLYITNSHFNSIYDTFASASTIKVDHCVVTGPNNRMSQLVTNSILYSSLRSGSTAKKNIFVGLNSTIGDGVQEMDNNWISVPNAGVWAAEGEDGSYAKDKTFELKYPNKYIGTDGTQVGLHGGNYPWNKIPSIPRIVESDIDTRTSADGKLKVSIKVEAQTKD